MPFPRGVADPALLRIMDQAMQAACARLAVGEMDVENRQRVAFLVTGFMRAGEHDPERLTDYVVAQFRQPKP